jgi:hypothetical protein
MVPSPPYPGERVRVRGGTSVEVILRASRNEKLYFRQPRETTPTHAPPRTPALSPEYGGEGVVV